MGSLTLLPVHSLETHRFVLRTDESMRVLQDSMRDQRAILTDTEFEKLEIAVVALLDVSAKTTSVSGRTTAIY